MFSTNIELDKFFEALKLVSSSREFSVTKIHRAKLFMAIGDIKNIFNIHRTS